MKDIRARDIMSTGIHHVSPQLHLIDLERELSSHRISGAPVLERGKVVGIVSRSDIDEAIARERTKAAAVATYHYQTDFPGDEGPRSAPDPTGSALESLRTLTVRDIMTSAVISVSADQPIVEVAELMRSKRIHRVLVITDGRLLGIVTSLDIVAAVADRG
jgi:CBS domain-containing protein